MFPSSRRNQAEADAEVKGWLAFAVGDAESRKGAYNKDYALFQDERGRQ